MAPWLMALAGTLAAKAQGGDQREQLAADIARRNAQRLGGNTDMLDAVAGQRAIDDQQSQSMGNMLATSLVGQLAKAGDKPTPQPAAAAPARAAGGMAGGIASPLTAGPLSAQYGAMNAIQSDPRFIEYLRSMQR